MSFAAIVLSVFTYIQSTKTALKVNSKEYQMSENLKYEVLKMIADLRAIDAKAASPRVKGKVDYSEEISSLSRMQSSPGYLLLLHSIKDDKKRLDLEETIRFFTESRFDDNMIREWCHRIIEILKTSTCLEKALKMNLDELVLELCEMKGILTNYEDSDAIKLNQITMENIVKKGDILVLNGLMDERTRNFKLRKFICDINDPLFSVYMNKTLNNDLSSVNTMKSYNQVCVDVKQNKKYSKKKKRLKLKIKGRRYNLS